MSIDIYLKDGSNIVVEDLKTIQSFRYNNTSGVVDIFDEKIDSFFLYEHRQYRFIGQTTAIVLGNSIKFILLN